mmetsp:Transcript_4518/g.8695  ORF Transcript_4518/g.8695 Transcript_4518/m.8695 type:complete len:700 (+) Transcript_4518:122-2221(+)
MPKNQGTSRKGKPKKADRAAGMGKALQKSQSNKFKVKSNGSSRGNGMAASGATSIGLEIDPNQAASYKIKSILETDDLTDFLARAELANKQFESERERFIVLDSVAQEVSHGTSHVPISAEKARAVEQVTHKAISQASSRFDFKELSVPRRPKWDDSTTPAELDHSEKEAFLNWRRKIAMYEEDIAASSATKVTATPFEKNIEVWRQLWRVLERSHLVALVVDGRNPEFYISMDLRTYVEDELGKSMIVIVNKCDYLTKGQREMWHEYFKNLNGLEHVFFSAHQEQEILDSSGVIIQEEKEDEVPIAESHDFYKAADDYPTVLNPKTIGIEKPLARKSLLDILYQYAEIKGLLEEELDTKKHEFKGKSRVIFGMVGFPNVGKSSVLNVLVGASKNNHKANRVGVASMPGKTKHFQTLNVPDYPNVTLCDCPGLVFPSFVSSSADLVLAGVYPLTQVKDFWPAVELICRRIPRDILEAHFGIKLPRPTVLDVAQQGGTVVLKPPTAEELLGTYCIARSLLAPSSGVPDHYRASRVVLKDYVSGNLLYCHCPPPVSQKDKASWETTFHKETLVTTFRRQVKLREKMGIVENIDGNFVAKEKTLAKKGGEDVDVLGQELEMLDMLDMSEKPNGGNRGKAHKSIQKWGKKGRKHRNKDPYGCHSEPDESILSNGSGSGLIVNAGKYSHNSYTRMNYRGAKSAV